MQPLWIWCGTFFGYRRRDDLFTKDGKCVGRFRDDEVFDASGLYLGEVQDGRLIRYKAKRGRMGPAANSGGRATIPSLPDEAEKRLPSGFEDFPTPTAF